MHANLPRENKSEIFLRFDLSYRWCACRNYTNPFSGLSALSSGLLRPANDSRRSSSDACSLEIVARLFVPATSLTVAWRSESSGPACRRKRRPLPFASAAYDRASLVLVLCRQRSPCSLRQYGQRASHADLEWLIRPKGRKVLDRLPATAQGMLFSPAANARHSSPKSK